MEDDTMEDGFFLPLLITFVINVVVTYFICYFAAKNAVRSVLAERNEPNREKVTINKKIDDKSFEDVDGGIKKDLLIAIGVIAGVVAIIIGLVALM